MSKKSNAPASACTDTMDLYRDLVCETLDGVARWENDGEPRRVVAFPANLHDDAEDLRGLSPANLQLEARRIRLFLQEPYRQDDPWLPLWAVVAMDAINLVTNEDNGFAVDQPEWHAQLERVLGPHMRSVPIAAIEFTINCERLPFAGDVRTMMRMLAVSEGADSRGRSRTPTDDERVALRRRRSCDECDMTE